MSSASAPAAVWTHLLRAAVAAGLLWLALRGVSAGALAAVFARTSWLWLAGVLALVLVDRYLMACRWIALVRASEPAASVSTLALHRTFLVSAFAGTLLPGSIGGDAVRAVSASRLGLSTTTVVGSVAIDRLIGTVSVLLMAVVGVLCAGRLLDARVLPWVAAVSGAVTLAALVLIFDTDRLDRVVRAAGGGRWPRVERLTRKTVAALGQYRRDRPTLLRVLLLSLVVQALRTAQAWGLGLSLGFDLSPLWYFALIPIVVIVLLLPISVAGLGSGNLAFVQLFALAGLSADEANALSFLFIALGPLGSLPGGLLLFLAPALHSDRRTP